MIFFITLFINGGFVIMSTEQIVIYPENNKQSDLFKTLLKEMSIHFEIIKIEADTLLTEKDFYKKIDKSLKQSKVGNVKILLKNEQKDLLGL